MISMHMISEGDADYPEFEMLLVEHKERYNLFSIDVNGRGLVVVPLFQVIDAISSVKPNYTIKNGKKYCSNCWQEVTEVEADK